jgi:hypothetical protein
MTNVVPRPRTLIAVLALCAGAGIGAALFRVLKPSQLADLTFWASGGVFGFIVLIWAARASALEAIKSLELLSTSEARSALDVQGEVSLKTFQLIVCVFLCAAVVAVPWVSVQLVGLVWEWMVVAAGAAAAAGLVCLYLAFYWREHVSHTADEVKARAEQARQQADLIKQMGALPPDADTTTDWAKQPPRELATHD